MHKIYILIIAGLICPLAAMAEKTTVSNLAGLQTALAGTADTIIVSQTIEITSDVTLDGNNKVVQVATPFCDESGLAPEGSDWSWNCPEGRSNYGLFTVYDENYEECVTLTLRNMTLLGGWNSANDAAGCVYVDEGCKLVADHVNFTRSYRGIFVSEDATAVLTHCNVVRNVCRFGAGIQVTGGIMVMDNCSLSENRTLSTSGGGGALEFRGTAYLNNTVISNNSSSQNGGAINAIAATVYMANCTVTGNVTTYALYKGGGLIACGANIYAVNSIFTDNYYDNSRSASVESSDIAWESGNETIDLQHCVYGTIVYEDEFSLWGGSGSLTTTSCREASTSDQIFTDYRQDGVIRLASNLTTPFRHPLLTRAESGSYNFYAPEAAYCTTGGVKTYFDYSDLSNIKMGYHNGTSIVALGNLTAPAEAKKVTTYFEGGTRSETQVGASGLDTRTYYTLSLSPKTRQCQVKGATIFGDSYASGTSLTVKATPSEGYSLQGWYETSQKAVEGTDNPYTFTLTSDKTLLPLLCVVTDQNDPTADLTTWKNSGDDFTVMIKRTFYCDNGYNTICLPFNLTAQQLAVSPLAGYSSLKEFSSATVVHAGEANETLVLTLTDVNSIEAGKPYIITWESGENIVNPVFDGVTITATAGTSSSTVNNVTFCGTLVPYAVEADDLGILFVGNGGNLHWPNVGGNIKGMRGYFTVNLGSNNAPARGARAFFGDTEDATAISTVATEQNKTRIQKLIENGRVVIISNGQRYNMNGQIVE